jgi:hypothetical protein
VTVDRDPQQHHAARHEVFAGEVADVSYEGTNVINIHEDDNVKATPRATSLSTASGTTRI